MTRLFVARFLLYLIISLGAVWVSVVDDRWTPEASFWIGAYLASCVFVLLSHGDAR